MITWLLAAAAWAGTCNELVPLDRDRLSVALVAPAGKRVSAGAWLTVVPTSRLRTWASEEDADVGRLLQGLGLRKAARAPKRAWIVSVFDVHADTLCRPIDLDSPDGVAGTPVCERGDRGIAGKHTTCATTVDQRTGGEGLEVFQIRWRDAAGRGFCVLPAARFLRGE